jgi:EAL domain-containing protein (putative c-di-GMP-specific phosphodiesterase class I)
MVPQSPSATTENWGSPSLPCRPHRADSARDLWFLTGLLSEFGTVRNVPIHSSPFTIGRRHDQRLRLEGATVSGQHAQITEHERRLLISDLGSTNGTYVNGHRIHRVTELKEDDLVQFAQFAFRVKRQTAEFDDHTQSEHMHDQALSLVQFDKLMNERAITPYFQPIVDMRTLRVVGQEVLARSRIYGLEMPLAMFQAAAQLDLAVELSRMFRWEGIRYFASLPDPPLLFVNTHPHEISTPGLIDSLTAIRKVSPRQPLVLEVHEAAATSASSMRELHAALRELKILLAYDDFGAGENRLIELIEAPPDFLKFDMVLVRDLDASEHRQQLLASLLKVTQDLHIISVAEGIETAAEAEACQRAGFELAQGFFYGRPAPAAQPV